MVAFSSAGGQQRVSDAYTNTVSFHLDSKGAASVSTAGCVVERISIRFNDDQTFTVGQPIGDISACANPDDEGQHSGDPLSPGSTVRWTIDGGRLTLTPISAPDHAVMYDDLASPQPTATASSEPIASLAFCSLVSDAVEGRFDFTNEVAVVELTNDPSLTEHQRVLMGSAVSDAVRQIKAGSGFSNDLLVSAVNDICGLHLTPVTMVE